MNPCLTSRQSFVPTQVVHGISHHACQWQLLALIQICELRSRSSHLVHQHLMGALRPACCAACLQPAYCFAARGLGRQPALRKPKYQCQTCTLSPGRPGLTSPAAPAEVAGLVRRSLGRWLGAASGMLRHHQCVWGGPGSPSVSSLLLLSCVHCDGLIILKDHQITLITLTMSLAAP